jgi:hypothetical protein
MTSNYIGNNRRGGLRMPSPQHCHPLVREFVGHINEQQTTLAEISSRSGVAVDTLRFWPTRHMPRLDLFDAALNTLDLELAIVPRGTRDKRVRRQAIAAEQQGATP